MYGCFLCKIKIFQVRMICHLVETLSQGTNSAEHIFLIVHQREKLESNLECSTFLSWNESILQPMKQVADCFLL